MLKTFIFATGMAAGAVALPATLIYVKPVRRKIAQVISKKLVHIITNDAEARADLIDIATDITAGLILVDEIKKAR